MGIHLLSVPPRATIQGRRSVRSAVSGSRHLSDLVISCHLMDLGLVVRIRSAVRVLCVLTAVHILTPPPLHPVHHVLPNLVVACQYPRDLSDPGIQLAVWVRCSLPTVHILTPPPLLPVHTVFPNLVVPCQDPRDLSDLGSQVLASARSSSDLRSPLLHCALC